MRWRTAKRRRSSRHSRGRPGSANGRTSGPAIPFPDGNDRAAETVPSHRGQVRAVADLRRPDRALPRPTRRPLGGTGPHRPPRFSFRRRGSSVGATAPEPGRKRRPAGSPSSVVASGQGFDLPEWRIFGPSRPASGHLLQALARRADDLSRDGNWSRLICGRPRCLGFVSCAPITGWEVSVRRGSSIPRRRARDVGYKA